MRASGPAARRAAALLAVALAALALAPAAQAEDPRLAVTVPHPLPGWRLAVHEDPSCATHRLLWLGLWDGAAAGVNFGAARGPPLAAALLAASPSAAGAWATGSAAGALALDDPAMGAALDLGALAVGAAEDGARRAPGWVLDPLGPVLWLAGAAGDEDVCLLRLVELTTGL